MTAPDKAPPTFVAKVIINEVSPVYNRVFKDPKLIEYFYKMPLLTVWVTDLIQLYYNKTISKIVFREMLEWHCLRTLIAATGSLEVLKLYNDFCAKSTKFVKFAGEFDSLVEELTKECFE